MDSIVTADEMKLLVRKQPQRWFAILDACDEPKVPPKIQDLIANEIRASSLYKGQSAQDYWAIAPYLCELNPEILQWIESELSGKPWGMVIECKAEFSVLYRHLRTLLSVRSPEEELWYFRFYDPRVLSSFLKTSETDTKVAIFGPIAAFYLELQPNAWTSLVNE